MKTADRPDDIQVSCAPSFERNWGRFQHVCWFVMVLLLFAAVSGLLGHGPLSRATAHAAGSAVQVHYERLARREAPAILELRFDQQAIASGQVCVRLNRELVNRLQIKDIVPTPLSSEPLADGARYTFQTDPTLGSATVVFIENPLWPGIFEGEVAVEGRTPVRFCQYVFP